ncbi:uncharacterized protein LOC129587380 [Paramacrobiotus metropolitanus]|uniref:uncharacterized protein LOC129587380 n=1 Tax=Paramacrobiotus metropolitanus TaxID=2943436 RepID=UPI002445EE3D|nr:uncharacterized protein LOC129587380 [Paramacrobiotus metropolitanus]
MVSDHSGSAILSSLNSDVSKLQQLIVGKTYRMKFYDVSELKANFRKEASVLVQFYTTAKTLIESAIENPVDIETITPLSQAHEHADLKHYMTFVESVGYLDNQKKTRNGERAFRTLKVWDCSQALPYELIYGGTLLPSSSQPSTRKKLFSFTTLCTPATTMVVSNPATIKHIFTFLKVHRH